MRTPPPPYLSSIQVEAGFDVADNRIVQELAAGDLVITTDIPLASEVIENNAHALDPRGEFYSKENMQEHLTMLISWKSYGLAVWRPQVRVHLAQQIEKLLRHNWIDF